MSAESTFIEAGRNYNLCTLTDLEGNTRTVEPYMVYTSAREKKLFHCYQVAGFSESGQATGWKNPEIAAFLSAEALADTFAPRDEYNPFNYKMFPVVHFSIPTRNGRQR
jgi:hypothetical protein